MSKVYTRDVVVEAGARLLLSSVASFSPFDFGRGFTGLIVETQGQGPFIYAKAASGMDDGPQLSLLRIVDTPSINSRIGSLDFQTFTAVPKTLTQAMQGIAWGNFVMRVDDNTVGAESAFYSFDVITAGSQLTAFEIHGTKLVSNAPIFVDSIDTKTGAGAISLTTQTTELVTTGANAMTLAMGVPGQTKKLLFKTDGGDATVTVSGGIGFSTLTFSSIGQTASLDCTATGWYVTAIIGTVKA